MYDAYILYCKLVGVQRKKDNMFAKELRAHDIYSRQVRDGEKRYRVWEGVNLSQVTWKQPVTKPLVPENVTSVTGSPLLLLLQKQKSEVVYKDIGNNIKGYDKPCTTETNKIKSKEVARTCDSDKTPFFTQKERQDAIYQRIKDLEKLNKDATLEEIKIGLGKKYLEGFEVLLDDMLKRGYVYEPQDGRYRTVY